MSWSPTNDSRHALEINQFKQCKDRVKSIAAFITHIKNKPFKIIGVNHQILSIKAFNLKV